MRMRASRGWGGGVGGVERGRVQGAGAPGEGGVDLGGGSQELQAGMLGCALCGKQHNPLTQSLL